MSVLLNALKSLAVDVLHVKPVTVSLLCASSVCVTCLQGVQFVRHDTIDTPDILEAMFHDLYILWSCTNATLATASITD